ncbi:ParB N-terminal domain-containing protein [Sulfitobacter mediterraneus]|uniref:ParB/RepB/Spo0J family partition protein n=1 Tax=Sulfitobacter mediterraneus TaxID=83219 RepID=UPI001939C649|nr:ParB N-terminal domain-containing protein [Sulfitobacter mediterraneus]MBM1558620.1 ParB N-terminal domain-containing protein [Sulfitobacter mediterraneus]MBM1569998.1 ParB N-terminal domain-containing protein [Sulfitobacter mediterraneus]MBM1573940.1 ParB N-terminal domain-containing protein [Sulfitobacter mediterraneus]MBM1577714.1 ParB N-terminal domain-containing protein [Sulfitobacter mediterraneus]MBM1581615.1 ParB N-terminal domain-containing protein [Sulfitobacter mediterraneus]
MVKRKRLETPSVDDLSRIEEEFRRETSPRRGGLAAPIAQVAADSADAMVEGAQARDQEDAKAMRAAREQGLVIMQLPLARIQADAMIRDRTVLNAEEMSELQTSISLNGLRLPIEVFALPNPDPDGPQYGILSGFRRFKAMQHLFELTGEEKYSTIKAVLRDPDQMGGAFAAMIEENEIRASLSHFERGRIVVIAVQQGSFVNVEAAVDALFPSASKAKRSKIRSFALIFEELGDMFKFPEMLREKEGLKLAQALRQGGGERLREVLATDQGSTPQREAELLGLALAEFDGAPKDKSRGGRPAIKTPKPGWQDNETLHLSSGITLRREEDSQGYVIRLHGRGLSSDIMDSVMLELQHLLEKP